MKKKLTSKDLDLIQDILTSDINERMSDQMVDYEQIIKIVKVLSKIDHNRRLAWNKEKFGPYEAMADEALNTFASDDIPF